MTNKTSGMVVKIPAPATHNQTIGVLIAATDTLPATARNRRSGFVTLTASVVLCRWDRPQKSSADWDGQPENSATRPGPDPPSRGIGLRPDGWPGRQGRGGRGQYRQATRLSVRWPVIRYFGAGTEEGRRASARLGTSTARPAATPPATPVLGASPSSPMPTATLATGVTAAMTGSVTMGRPAW